MNVLWQQRHSTGQESETVCLGIARGTNDGENSLAVIDTDRLDDSGWAYKIHGGNPLTQLLSSGMVTFYNEEKHPIVLRALLTLDHVNEHHFDLTDKEIQEITKQVATLATSLWCASRSTRTTSAFFLLVLATLMTTPASATSTTTTSSSTAAPNEADDNRSLITFNFAVLVLATEWLLFGAFR